MVSKITREFPPAQDPSSQEGSQPTHEELEAEIHRLKSELMIFRGNFNSAPTGRIVADTHGTIRHANYAAERLFGRLAGRSLQDDVLHFVRKPQPTSSEDSQVCSIPQPHGKKMLELLLASEDDITYESGVVDRVDIHSPHAGILDASLSLKWTRQSHCIGDEGHHPLFLSVEIVDIGSLVVDALTGLWTQKTLWNQLDLRVEENNRCIRDGNSPNSLVAFMFDIDYFKPVNDEHGHPAGDRVIRAIAGILKASFRKNDLVVRYGGEEFVAIADMDPKAALRVAERVRRLVEGRLVRVRSQKTGGHVELQVTISSGLAIWFPGMLPSELIAEADKQLYRSKNGGRNRTSARIQVPTMLP